MSKFDLNVWVTEEFQRGWTHIVKGNFADPQLATQAATDIFCYNQNTGIGAFFATVKNGLLDDGTPVPDGPHHIGGNHTFDRGWTHVVSISAQSLLLFYDASSGVAEIYGIDGSGGLILKRQYSGWRTSWSQIIAGHYGKAGLLLYDASTGDGEFYSVSTSGNIQLVSQHHGWKQSWYSIINGNFSDSHNDDLLFYDKSIGSGEFYWVDDNANIHLFCEHDNWRTTWQTVISGQFLQFSNYDGLLFFEEGSHYTEFYATDGHGNISQINIDLGTHWHLPWQVLLAGQFVPNLGIIGDSSLCAYQAEGVISYFYFAPGTIRTVIDLNGRWTDGSGRSAVITSALTAVTVNMTAFNRPSAAGEILNPTTIKVHFPDDDSPLNPYFGFLEPPNLIRWSNNSNWTKI